MIEWHTKEPPAEGWYDCLLNGEELPLRWWVCKMNPRKRHWVDSAGAYREFDGAVQWTGSARATEY